MNIKYFISIKAIAIVSVAIALILNSCSNNDEDIGKMLVMEDGPAETSENVVIYVSRSGNISYEFSSPLYCTYKFPNVYDEAPKGFKISTFNFKHEVEAELSANYGIHYVKKHIMEAKNNVVIKNLTTGEMIETEHLVWDVEKQKVYSNTTTKQTCADGSVYIGDSFESDENFEHYTIKNPKLIIYEE